MENMTAMATAIRPAGELAAILVPELPSGPVFVVVVVDAGVAADVVLLKIAASGEFAGMPRSSVQTKNKKFKLM